MGSVLRLSLRQLAGVRRLLIVSLLTLLPVALALVIRLFAPSDETDPEDFITGIIDAILVAGILPLVTMAVATSSFGNELEDKTLSYIMLKPVPRWKIALPKLIASILVVGPLVVVSGVAAAYIGLDSGFKTPLAVGVALLVGVVAYSAVFTWAGLITTRALSFAIVYVFLWEGAIGTFISGVRYLSVRGYTLAVMHGLDETGLESISDRVIEFPAAIGGALLVTAVFFWLTIWRLRKMDVP
jgi:ABC-2 type transport system permease protein